jgi:hypothetical protein
MARIRRHGDQAIDHSQTEASVIQIETNDNLARGLPPEAARSAPLRKFGNSFESVAKDLAMPSDSSGAARDSASRRVLSTLNRRERRDLRHPGRGSRGDTGSARADRLTYCGRQ